MISKIILLYIKLLYRKHKILGHYLQCFVLSLRVGKATRKKDSGRMFHAQQWLPSGSLSNDGNVRDRERERDVKNSSP